MITLRQLQKRINDVVAENDARGYGDRNDMPVLLELRRETKRFLRRYYPAGLLHSGMMTVADNKFGCTIHVDEKDEIKL